MNTEELPAIPPGVTLHTLDNGLTIILREDHSAPVVSVQAWCKTGSIHEGNWMGAGLSHVLEHMLFKGTSTRAGTRIDQEVQEAGGYMNAYTSFDRTVYWINVPNTGCRVAVDVLCDVMQNATLPPEELAKELDVIRREMDMNVDDPQRRAGRRLFETAYTRSPYRFTVIGYRDIFDRLQPSDITAYYRGRYAPNNMFFVVVGDIKAGDVIEQIRSAFARSKAQPLPPMVLSSEPIQTAPREVIEEAPIELGHFHFSWHIPGIRHPDVPLLDVLATLLGAGRSSRLYQVVREQKGLVTCVDAWTYNPGDTGLFGMSASAEPAHFRAARAAMLEQIERLKNEIVPAEELSKVIKQFIAGILSTRKTMQGQAQDLGGSWLAADDLNFSERYLRIVKRATSADLQRIARQYLTSENRTLYALLPEGTASQTAVTIEQQATGEVQKIELPNGLRLLIKEDHRLPFVEYRAMFKGGVLAENSGNNGLTQLMARMLLKGTQTRSAQQIVTEVESLGGSIDTFSGNNSFGVSAELLSSDFEIGMTLLADVVLNPIFPSDALEREREMQLADIRAQRDHLLQSSVRAMRRVLYGNTAYGLDALGSEKSVQKLKQNNIRQAHQQLTAPENCVVAVFGDVKATAVKKSVERLFGSWKTLQPSTFKTDFQFPAAAQARRVSETREKKQAVLVIGFPGTRVGDEERFALELLQEACSDLGSRLFVRIRENLGLAYFVGAQNLAGLLPGYFAFYCGTSPEKLKLVESEFLKEIDVLRTEGLTAEELGRSKAKLLGQRKISRQDVGNQASSASMDELYGLGFNFSEREDERIESVTLEAVKQAARNHLRTEAAVIASIGPDSGSSQGCE